MFNRYFSILIVFLITNSCIEPIVGTLGDYKDLLVVDGQITNEDGSYEISLLHTVSNIDQEAVVVEGAVVLVEDDQGNAYSFVENLPGKYISNASQFTGKVGRTYELYIKTKEGKEYRSEPCLLNVPSKIDSVYFLPEEFWAEYEEVRQTGIGIYINGSSVNKDNNYLRWSYDENWKFKVPYPSNQIVYDDDMVVRVDEKNVYCWKSDFSKNIIIHSFQNQIDQNIVAKKLLLIPSGETDKLTIRYSVLVKQYSISKKEYEFWNQLKQSTEDIGDIFGKQPFSINSNLKNINDPKEPVLGYFQVAGVSSKRIYINREEVEKIGIPINNLYDDCSVDPFIIDGEIYLTIYGIYQSRVVNGSLSIVEPIFDASGIKMIGLMLTGKKCADCSLTGNVEPPSFWEE
jgi:hypothetical protein